MHHLETLIQAIPPAVFVAGGILPPNSAGQTAESATSPVAPFSYPSFPSGVPPPSLHVFPLTNPSTHFTRDPNSAHDDMQQSQTAGIGLLNPNHRASSEQLAEDTSRMSLTASYLYFDDEGYTRWQGETSGLPVLDLLVERHAPNRREHPSETTSRSEDDHASRAASATNTDWFPNRTPRRTDVNPETLWRLMTSYIVPELMDRYFPFTKRIHYETLTCCIALFNAIYPHPIIFYPFFMFRVFLPFVYSLDSDLNHTLMASLSSRITEIHKNGVNPDSQPL